MMKQDLELDTPGPGLAVALSQLDQLCHVRDQVVARGPACLVNTAAYPASVNFMIVALE